MSAASDYLKAQIQQAARYRPAVTFVTCQRSTEPPGKFGPGIASFGWGFGGNLANGPAGNGTALAFNLVYQWFSDRLVDDQVNLSEAQAFTAKSKDSLGMTFALNAAQTSVELTAVLQSRGNAQWQATTDSFDAASEQLIFEGVPGAGAGAPPALLIASFSPANVVGEL